jgi:hypothetical protein
MLHVSLDLFRMSPVKEGENTYDTMAVCVDRHSGWVIAVPCQNRGLTGKKVALAMLKEWRIFGIPSILTSDQGSHFVGEWWKNMCAALGIRHAYSQAYHHRANGRAEMAGQQVKEILRKILTDQKRLTWVEALPQALDRLHDAKGPSGLSPYEILFGRPRPLGNLPFAPEKDCEDAIQFFTRMRNMDDRVKSVMEEIHQSQATRANRGRRAPEPFAPGDKVWYRRPENSGAPEDSRWLGPCVVKSREGESSYTVEVKPNYVMKAHRSFLKPYVMDIFNGEPVPLFFITEGLFWMKKLSLMNIKQKKS